VSNVVVEHAVGLWPYGLYMTKNAPPIRKGPSTHFFGNATGTIAARTVRTPFSGRFVQNQDFPVFLIVLLAYSIKSKV
jgi:hypothetical protein